MTPILDVAGISKDYGRIAVLKDVSFTVPQHGTFAVIGPNGAGKTTIFKVLTGEVSASTGTIHYNGVDVTAAPVWRRSASGMARTFQVARIFPEMTVAGNIVLALEARSRQEGRRLARLSSVRCDPAIREEADAIAQSVRLGDKRSVQGCFLSHGDKKRLDLAMALALRPSLLMMDEPTAGMSPIDREATIRLLQDVKRAYSVAIMLTEHDMDVVFGLADTIMVLNYGAVVAIGKCEEIRGSQAVRDIYFGEEMGDA